MTYARIVTFHVDREHMPGVIEALDTALYRFRHDPGFEGLLCLEHDGPRQQVMIITLWDTEGLMATAWDAEAASQLIADATDTDITSRVFQVLGFVPGASAVRGAVPAGTGPP